MTRVVSIFCFMLLIACSNKKGTDAFIFPKVYPEAIPLSSFFSDYSLLRINLPNELSVGQITQAILHDSTLYIFDGIRSRVLGINIHESSLDFVLNASGDGPEEYVSLNAIDVDPNGFLHLYDFGRKILVFEKDQFVKSIPINAGVRGFGYYRGGYAFYTPDFSYKSVGSSLVSVDQNGLNPIPLAKTFPSSKIVIPERFSQRVSPSEIYFNDLNGKMLVLLSEDKSPQYLEFQYHKDSIDPKLVGFQVFSNHALITFGYELDSEIYAETALFDLETKKATSANGLFNDLNGLHIQKIDVYSLESNTAISIFTDEDLIQFSQMLEDRFLGTYFKDIGNYWSSIDQPSLRLSKESIDKARTDILNLTQEDGNYLIIHLLK